MSKFSISPGFSDAERADVARLYWQAFSAKLGRSLGPDVRAQAFFAQIISPDFALIARSPEGKVIGVAGFKTAKGALTGGGMQDIAQHYGWLGALWKGPLLGFLTPRRAVWASALRCCMPSRPRHVPARWPMCVLT